MCSPINGFIWVSNDDKIPFCFENNTLTLYFTQPMCVMDEDVQEFYGESFNPYQHILFHLTFPISSILNYINFSGESKYLFGNVSFNVDYYITNYRAGLNFNKAIFSFDELNIFIPSVCNCSYKLKTNKYVFYGRSRELKKFSFSYMNRKVKCLFRVNTNTSFNEISSASTSSEIILMFDDTNDIKFIVSLFRLIKNLFSFLCNRRNISLQKTVLESKNMECFKTIVNGQELTENKEFYYSSSLFVLNNYLDDFESEKEIKKTINYGYVASHIKQLVQLICDDKVSLSSIHSCKNNRNIIDLDQSLHITAAFEYYQRKFLPQIVSHDTIEFYSDIKEILQKYAEKETGKKKKKANDIIKHLMPNVSLQEKILKAYNGYEGWVGLGGILDEWFKDRVIDLAKVANEWRNELAHEKNEYQPDRRVIDAVRLVEHINYCIVLRQAHYSDDEIKSIISHVLSRS